MFGIVFVRGLAIFLVACPGIVRSQPRERLEIVVHKVVSLQQGRSALAMWGGRLNLASDCQVCSCLEPCQFCRSLGCLNFFIKFDENNVDSSDYALLVSRPQRHLSSFGDGMVRQLMPSRFSFCK